MKITFQPSRGLPGKAETAVAVRGETITVDSATCDFSVVPEGGEATPKGDNHPFIGKIRRIDGEIHCTVRVRLGDDATGHQPRDPAHWTVTVTDGPVAIPALRKEKDQ